MVMKKLKYKIQEDNYYEKLVAAVLTGVLVAGTLSTGVYAKDDDKTITVAASATPHAEILEEANRFLRKKDMNLKLLYLMTM